MSSEQLRNRSEEPNLRATAAVLPAFLPGAGIVASAIGPHGNRYCTASQGGANGYGVVWAFQTRTRTLIRVPRGTKLSRRLGISRI
jgi:hypothetical protein